MRELGYQAKGIDPFVPHDIHDRFGVRVERKTLEQVSDTYDVLLFRHSLEHMPIDTLRVAHRRLNPNGVCVVCIPIVGWAWRHYKTNWVQLDAPRHLFLHSRESFTRLAQDSGFQLKHVVFDSNEFQFWASEAYKNNVPLVRATPPSFGASIRMRQRARFLNRRGLGDTAQFYMQRM